MRVFIANFGIANGLWPRCKDLSVALTYEDDDKAWPLWQAGDRDGFIAFSMANKITARGISVTKPVAARWFNLACEVRDSSSDVWIHRERDDLWWTMTTDSPANVELVRAPWPSPTTEFIHVLQKPTDVWRNTTQTGGRLLWSGLHPKARQFLFTEGTLQKLAPENAKYALALIAGDDLSRWHSLPTWQVLIERAGHSEVRSFSSWEKSSLRMALTAEETARASTRAPTLQFPKLKNFGFRNAHELAEYLLAVVEAQDYCCALSGLPLEADGDHQDLEFLASLDRIDSAGHYERGNLQVVCRFINRWKSDGDNETFKRLLLAVRGQGSV